MRVKYIGDYYKVSLQKNKIYEVLGIEDGWYKILDETGEECLFPPNEFTVADD